MILFSKILFKNRQPKHNPDGIIFNYSKIYLPDAEKSLYQVFIAPKVFITPVFITP